MGSPITNLGLSCPKSGSFYICEDQPTRFVGCCTINPCTTHDGLCPDDDVRPASFSPNAYDKILAQDCLGPGFLWYTCRDSSPPFLGCCSQMACEAGGCPVNKVGAASLSGNAKQAAPFLSAGTSTSSTTSRASSTTLSTAVSTTVSDPTQQNTQPPAGPPSAHAGLSKGAIGGISVAAVAGACILVLVAFWALRLRRKRQSSMAVGGSGKTRLDEDREDLLTDYQDGKPAASHTLLGGHSGNTAAGQLVLFPPAQASPALKSPVISELPATPSQQSVNSGVTPATRHIASMSSLNGAGGRESAISGITASAQQSPQLKQQSPLIHQSLFELEGSSSRAFVGRKQ
ncbi:hypothetical protein TARUN_2053 [Trichoderma arundinaceum]|uniref:Uncharacterized protein n=1 Tax=Trichoderma arundinaceum TaxID=490622 RepID=A0A395NVQ7_TRIAR|nr:hypothetical protein TARUN_2053 [Trichoderma arundinaceum]